MSSARNISNEDLRKLVTEMRDALLEATPHINGNIGAWESFRDNYPHKDPEAIVVADKRIAEGNALLKKIEKLTICSTTDLGESNENNPARTAVPDGSDGNFPVPQ